HRASWREGVKGLLEQQAAALFTLAMQDVPCGGDRVSSAEIRFEQVTFHELETVSNSETSRHFPRNRDNARPINRSHADMRGLLRESDAPYAGPRGQIEHRQGRRRLGDAQRFAQLLGGGVMYGKNVFDKPQEKRDAVP